MTYGVGELILIYRKLVKLLSISAKPRPIHIGYLMDMSA